MTSAGRWLRGGLGQLTSALGGLVVVAWGIGAPLLAGAGMLGLAVALLIDVWQRHCLTGVTYQRQLSQRRALFGEEVQLTVSFTNDKLLPLSWLHTEDEVRSSLPILGGHVNDFGGPTRTLDELVVMRPYQRVERQLTVVCERRGVHRFGPARAHSGDPIGYRECHKRFDSIDELLVYPKVFALRPVNLVSRVALGPARATRVVEDPMRIVGHREYQAGDPLRQIDWRATARSTTTLVRVCDPSATLSAALFVDTSVPQLRGSNTEPPELEFVIAVAASVAANLGGKHVGLGLFSNGSVNRKPIGHAPDTSPLAVPHILELLARASPFGAVPFDVVLRNASTRLPAGTSVVVIAADFPRSTLLAMTDVRRRGQGLTAIVVATSEGEPPPSNLAEVCLKARYSHDWQSRAWLDLAS